MKIAVVTGTSAGIGQALAILLSQKGYKVYGLSRRIVQTEDFMSISVDVTNKKQVEDAFKKIYDQESRIDVVVNNAGMGISGSVEYTTPEDLEAILNVNIKGVTYVTQAALPYMRLQSHGKLVNIASVAGELSIPFQSFYSATKAFVISFGDALYHEVKPYGIQVSTILPGDIKTDFTSSRKKNGHEDIYQRRVEKSIGVMEKDEQNGMTKEYAAKIIYRVIQKRKMPLHKTIGFKYKVFLLLRKILPIAWIQKVVGKLYAFKKD